MAARLNLVSASAGKRVGAWLIDKLPPAVLVGIGYGVGMAGLLGAAGSGFEEATASAAAGLFLWLGITSLLALAYGIWKWGWEARTGKTPGNVLLGLRTANEDGNAPGWAAIFIRGLIIAVGGLVPVVGAVIVVISNLWDANHQRQGWHDKVAKTLALDVNAGRDPLTTGGLYGHSTFTPEDGQAGVPQPSFVGAPAGGPGSEPSPQSPRFDDNAARSGGIISGIPGFSGPPAVSTPAGTPAGSTPSGTPAVSSPAGTPADMPAVQDTHAAPVAAAPAAPGAPESAPGSSAPTQAPPSHVDDEFAFTRIREAAPAPTDVAGSGQEPAGLNIRFDDGREVAIGSSALIGRNPAAAAGEEVDQLIDFADLDRSVSKTHLELRVEGGTVWVNDRNSTNGTAVTGSDGVRQQLVPGAPVAAKSGATVEFGDRSFVIGQA
ncbi:RDD family protein [Arthrobacter sp. VKM Ac-2550]|uniref:RDD family protein n=1 Tax=Crystallibacter permensis TaxID=1938888 RepID=UPI002227B1FB|nr:RDD family protein [Arthrobacter sp. VKM Ac-2550]MCW2131394.1 Forkhead associated (FHA) domain, binds pSer, pThr, pTyr [Arthrobacter sp. VKM Ac-2550]